MTQFREDLEYWTDQLVTTQMDIDRLLTTLENEPQALTREDLRFLAHRLGAQKAMIHWLDRTVNHYPDPPKKFWQFWKK